MSGARVVCAACGRDASFDGPVPRRATCEGCGVDLHCCRNCRHHDPSIYNECSESAAERVLDKDASNFCDWFQPAAGGRDEGAGEAPSGLDELERLFKS